MNISNEFNPSIIISRLSHSLKSLNHKPCCSLKPFQPQTIKLVKSQIRPLNPPTKQNHLQISKLEHNHLHVKMQFLWSNSVKIKPFSIAQKKRVNRLKISMRRDQIKHEELPLKGKKHFQNKQYIHIVVWMPKFPKSLDI